jgi:hypothetical protein
MSLRQLMVAKDISEAMQVKAFLQAQGISASVPDTHFNTILHYIQGSRVLVKSTDYEQAIKALREVNVGFAPGYTRNAKEEGTKKMNRALGASLLGLLGIPLIPNLYSMFLLLMAPRIYNLKFLITLLINIGTLSLWAFAISSYLDGSL